MLIIPLTNILKSVVNIADEITTDVQKFVVHHKQVGTNLAGQKASFAAPVNVTALIIYRDEEIETGLNQTQRSKAKLIFFKAIQIGPNDQFTLPTGERREVIIRSGSNDSIPFVKSVYLR